MGDGHEAQVRRRRVFYIPGYDPFPPRRYRELYRTEAAAQAAVSGHVISVLPGRDTLRGWRVEAVIAGAAVQTEFEVLAWSDIVKRSMGQGILASYGQLVRILWTYLSTGTASRLFRLRKGPTIAALYPIAVLIAVLALSAALGLLLGRLAVMALAPLDHRLGLLAGAVVCAATIWAGPALLRRYDGRTFVFYLLHDFAHAARAGGAYPADLDARLDAFAQEVKAALAGPWDEVLVVGHSSGAHLAVSVIARVIGEGGFPASGPALSLLTLGHVVPMVSFLPRATRLRADLRFLAARDEITWADVSAPGDGCAFALCDPVAVTGVAPDDKRWPLVISAAFTQTLSPGRLRALRWRFFRLHFQYLCAFDRPGDYDYFAITAGPQTLGQRFAGRLPSKSRIEVALSRHRSVA